MLQSLSYALSLLLILAGLFFLFYIFVNRLLFKTGEDEFYIKNLDDGKLNKLNTTVSASAMLKNELFGIEQIKDIKIVKS